MKSVKPSSDKRRRTYIRLVGEISHALNQALGEEHEDRNLTRAQMAATLGWDRASITKLLSGTRNMTLETLADLAFALDRPVRVSLPSRTRHTNKRMGKPDASDTGGNAEAAGQPKLLEAHPT